MPNLIRRVVFAPAGSPSECNEPETAFALAGAAGSHYVLRSDDHGATWQHTGGHFPNIGVATVMNISFANPCTAFAVGENSKAYKTENGGQTWTEVPVTGGNGATLFDVATWGDGSEAIAVAQNGRVFVLESTASAFVEEDKGYVVSEHLYDIEVLNGGTHVRIGGDEGVILFRDNGTWAPPRRSGTKIPITKVDFVSAHEGFAIGWMFAIQKYDDQ